jgi:hypothetical protein
VPNAPPISSSSINHSDNIKLAVQIVKRRTVQLSPVPCHFLTLTPKYLQPDPILEHSQPVFFTDCDDRPKCDILTDKPSGNSISLYLSVGNAGSRQQHKRWI